MVKDLREDLDAPEVPFIAGETGYGGLGEKINPALRQISSYVPFSSCVSAEGLSLRDDNVHFTREAQIELGQRYADAILKSF